MTQNGLPNASDVTNDRQSMISHLTESELVNQFDILRREYTTEQNELRSKYQGQFCAILSAIDRLHQQHSNIQ